MWETQRILTGYFYKNVKNLNKFVKVRGYKVVNLTAEMPTSIAFRRFKKNIKYAETVIIISNTSC